MVLRRDEGWIDRQQEERSIKGKAEVELGTGFSWMGAREPEIHPKSIAADSCAGVMLKRAGNRIL